MLMWHRSSGGRAGCRLPDIDGLTTAKCLEATRSIMSASRYGFVCIGSADGASPTCRIMDIHLHPSPNDSLCCSLITRDWTRKASELRRYPQCTLAFHDPRAAGENGYAVLHGIVTEVAEPSQREECWKPSWSYFHSGGPRGSSLIWRFVPDRIEVISHAHNIAPAWSPATILRKDSNWVLLDSNPKRPGS